MILEYSLKKCLNCVPVRINVFQTASVWCHKTMNGYKIHSNTGEPSGFKSGIRKHICWRFQSPRNEPIGYWRSHFGAVRVLKQSPLFQGQTGMRAFSQITPTDWELTQAWRAAFSSQAGLKITCPFHETTFYSLENMARFFKRISLKVMFTY